MRTAILLSLPLLVAGCASRSATTPAKPAAAKPAAAKPVAARPAAAATAPATPAPSGSTAGARDGADGSDDTLAARSERREAPELRPYDRVITKDAKSDAGVFTVHRIRDRVYYEIPKDLSLIHI